MTRYRRLYEVSDDSASNVCGGCVFRKIEALPFAREHTATCCHPDIMRKIEIVQTTMNNFDTMVLSDCPGRRRPKPKPFNVLEYNPSELCFRGTDNEIVGFFDNGTDVAETSRISVIFRGHRSRIHNVLLVGIDGRCSAESIDQSDVILESEKEREE